MPEKKSKKCNVKIGDQWEQVDGDANFLSWDGTFGRYDEEENRIYLVNIKNLEEMAGKEEKGNFSVETGEIDCGKIESIAKKHGLPDDFANWGKQPDEWKASQILDNAGLGGETDIFDSKYEALSEAFGGDDVKVKSWMGEFTPMKYLKN